MQRVIKFYNQYKHHFGEIDSCSTSIVEILPILVDDNAGAKELRAIAKKLGITKRLTVKKGKVSKDYSYRRDPKLSVYAATGETVDKSRYNVKEIHNVEIGFVSLVNGHIPASVEIDQDVPEDCLSELAYDADAYGIQDSGSTNDGGVMLVRSGWHYHTALPLLGYSLEKFEKALGITEFNFYDDSFQCSECGTYDDDSNGYTYNYRIVNGSMLGIRCGCHHAHCKAHVEDFANDAEQAIELETAEALAKDGKLEHMTRAIGGWVDGRGGSFNGESCDDGDPKAMLAEALKQYPKDRFVFSHDESGQFQTYFSMWRILPAAKAKPKAVKRPKKVTKPVAKARKRA